MVISTLCRSHILTCTSKLVTNPKSSHTLIHNSYYCKNVKYTTIRAIFDDKFSELKLESSSKVHKKDELHAAFGLKKEAMPKHIAIALDGNRRWLKAHGLELDYTPFFHKNILFAQLCLKWGIPKGTGFLWGLSNFTKRGKEKDLFLGQFQKFMEDNLEYFHRNGVKVMAIGETTMLSKSLQDTIKQVEEVTRNNTNLELALPICYTGQRDITNATRRLCEKVKQGSIEPSDINEEIIGKELSIPSSPIPELFIRVGGELRIGALFAWQIAYIELYFSDVMAPDFDEYVFIDALRSYQQRRRLFGK